MLKTANIKAYCGHVFSAYIETTEWDRIDVVKDRSGNVLQEYYRDPAICPECQSRLVASEKAGTNVQ
jgi:hypothetical protein